MILRHCKDPYKYAHLESKSVVGTHKGLEPHHLKMEKGTHTPNTKILMFNYHFVSAQLGVKIDHF